jgi:hypothetical protein
MLILGTASPGWGAGKRTGRDDGLVKECELQREEGDSNGEGNNGGAKPII